MLISIIIPTFNGASRIGNCLDALLKQTHNRDTEILVVNDGSTDETADVVARYPCVRLINQANAGPAAARNHGATEAKGAIILFTDDDCVPTPNWLSAMFEPFNEPEVIGVKGVYRTHQTRIIARFVQVEYEDRYRLMVSLRSIDFVDTYSAGFRRDKFLEMNGYDTTFPVACAEDAELSYRMSARGWIMKFIPTAVVYHTHPDTLWRYLKKKYKFAFWRVVALFKNPAKTLKDSHTPQVMKAQLLFPPALLIAMPLDLLGHATIPLSALVITAFLVSTLPFSLRAARQDWVVGLLSPMILAARACSQAMGVVAGVIYMYRTPSRAPADSVS
ncbi:MAG TPA: glycosyltransferase [Candidatus Sulfotelmatobacter sp.]|nr:glycosyltransferase [Candidatus Sulfotelmatobacter sp.]